jgi:hypothetical protein
MSSYFQNPRPVCIPPVSGMPRLVSFSPRERLDAARLGSRRLGDLLRGGSPSHERAKGELARWRPRASVP